jgi:oligopeptide transport system permease protein
VDSDFVLKDNAGDLEIDTNFAAQSFWKEVIHRFFRKRSAVFGMFMILFITLMAIVGPAMNEYTYSGQELSQKSLAPRVPGLEKLGILDGSEKLNTTSGVTVVNNYKEKGLDDVYYWFGSDNFGRDIWTRTWHGARISLIIAVVAAIIDMIIGMSYGLISGYFGGAVDAVMQRIVEVANSVPRLVIVSVLAIFMPKGMGLVIVALLLTEWIGMSKIARAEMLRIKEQEYVLASRTLGAHSMHIIFKQILPNTIGPIITQVMFSIPTAIFTEAFLSFVGVGIMLPQCSIGSLIESGFNNITTLPHQILPPIIVLALQMLGFNFIGDGFREALAPKLEDM